MTYFYSFDGTKIYYRRHIGQNPCTLVFLHGVGGNWTLWRKEMNYFQKRGFSTLVLDLRGHGQSDCPDEFERYCLPHFSHDLFSLLRQEKIKNFVLIGHSLGGAIAINYCMMYKQRYPRSVIFVETSSTYPFDHDRLLNLGPYVTHFLRFVASHKLTHKQHFFHFHDVDLSQEGIKAEIHLISHLLHLTPLRSIVKTLDNVEKFVFKNQRGIDETLRHMRIPTMVIGGEQDHIIPLKYVERIKELNKKSVLRILKGAHHKAIVQDSREVSQVIAQFLMTIL